MLSDPNMSLAEFIEKPQAIKAAGGRVTLHMPPGRGRCIRAMQARSIQGGFREKDTLTGEVRDAPGDDRQWDSDAWSRGRE